MWTGGLTASRLQVIILRVIIVHYCYYYNLGAKVQKKLLNKAFPIENFSFYTDFNF